MFLGLWLSTSWAQVDIDRSATYHIDGLNHSAEIIVDKWGIPHIYAQDHYDAFFVQGFNAARDRLWQIDLWRKRGLGQLSETFGKRFATQDLAARLFLYRKDMYTEWLSYGNDAKKIAVAFTDGINAYINLTRTKPELLPPEFTLLNYEPSQWAPEDVVRIRSNGLWRNVVTEVWRARLACDGELALAAAWKKLEPDWVAQIPQGLDPCSIPENVLQLYRLAKAPVVFDELVTAVSEDDPEIRASLGSNNWVVAPSRTSTGRPILADDPHRGHAVPSLRYIAHLNAPGLNVIGAGEPGLPGISIGHNEKIAFGLTIFPIDQEDLYVYKRRGDGYRYQNRTESLEVISERLNIPGEDPVQLRMKFTRHGPVIAETKEHVFAIRAAWLEPGMSPYFGSIEYMRAENFREFVGALNRWGAPSENQVYADIQGNIGYKPAGRFPVRRNWDGLLPVPGDGSYEWDGYFDMDVLPEEYNPERGFTGTANSMNLPPDYPINDYRVGFEWSAPWRYARLWEVLQEQNKHSIEDSLALQRDYLSVYARRTIGALEDLSDHGAPGRMLSNWDFTLEADSPAAALWNIWTSRHLQPQLGAWLVQGKDHEPTTPLDTLTVLSLLEDKAGRKVAYASLATAWDEAIELLGPDPDAWRWGDLHQIRFQHPLLHKAEGALKEQMTIAPYPRGGSANTTNNTGYRADDFLVRGGASFRMVVDVGNWDAALTNNAPGQSGDPRSKFYDNLLENWATESQFPMLFSKEAIQEHTEFTITLLPTDDKR
ncbi:MAG: penicillin acylase family protein [Pseudomonadota bacterium]